jgi:hypothetical protein
MAKLPPQPVGVAPGSSYWNDWYEKLRRFVEQATTSVDWSIITGKPTTLAGYGITDGQTTLVNSAGLAAALSDETGTGLAVFNNNPTLINPVLGTPASVTLTNGTGLPVSGITGFGAGVATFLATPSSANLAAAVTGETGTGALVFATSPSLVTPSLGVATATSLTATGVVVAGGLDGFQTDPVTLNARNFIWAFKSATTIGLSYFSGASGIGGVDTVGLHFGVATAVGSPWKVTQAGNMLVNGAITTGDIRLHNTSVALTNAAGAAVGTLNNAPVAGNPTKWIEINDNGTIRRIPTW